VAQAIRLGRAVKPNFYRGNEMAELKDLIDQPVESKK